MLRKRLESGRANRRPPVTTKKKENRDLISSLDRSDGRAANQLRPVRITPGFMPNAEGSALIETGNTHVICTASVEPGVPRWLKGKGQGWVTAEYAMLPRATDERVRRDRGPSVGGRTQEIQRLIGRSLRAAVDLKALGENSILIDCDVLRADGGTRTAAITGSFVALSGAISWLKQKSRVNSEPLIESIAAVSIGIVQGIELLDLAYDEDSRADVDMNVVMTAGGEFVEVQGTAEGRPYTGSQLDRLLELAGSGISQLIEEQQRAIEACKASGAGD
jgi:ribonuclease PH